MGLIGCDSAVVEPESYLTPVLCRQILGRIERLAWHST